MQLLQFEPIVKRSRWGGTRLASLLGKQIDADDCAESWEIADHGDDQSVVANGPLSQWTLSQLVHRRGGELLGVHAPRRQFPLLIKYLDAADRLSLQVHPDDEQAKRFDPQENGKTEAWVIIDAVPGSVLYAGLKARVDRPALERSLEEGTVDEVLHSFPVKCGDCVFIPAGTVHAIGEGILLAEVQQSSDITFRLHDWGRLGADGKPRQLHVEQALDCIDFDRGPVDPVVPKLVLDDDGHRIEELVRSPYFAIQRHSARSPFQLASDCRFHVMMGLGGLSVAQCGGEQWPLGLGQTLLIPAEHDAVRVVPHSDAVLLETFLPMEG